MTPLIKPAEGGSYIDVFEPMAFMCHGGRKTIVALNGTQPTTLRAH